MKAAVLVIDDERSMLDLLTLLLEPEGYEVAFYELALRVSGAVQAKRWTRIESGGGYIHSFNGPHSLFADTLRTLRVLALAHELGHVLQDEGDQRIPLLERLVVQGRSFHERDLAAGL